MRHFSLEFVICGRNDDYEPDWARRLESVIRYNRALMMSAGVDFRVGFAEWNPPPEKPLLTPGLAARYPFFRGVIGSPALHAQLCQAGNMSMMLNYSLNSILRTSTADFCVISGGDCFLGRDLAQRFSAYGLRREIVYRAVRVDIRNDLDFIHPTADVLEDPRHVAYLNACIDPPYSAACGDFILMDRQSFQNVRGFDESIRNARLHLDSRCVLTALALGCGVELIGSVYHIDHLRSYNRVGDKHYQGQRFDLMAGIPYRNSDTWGLGDRKWRYESERVAFVQ